MNWNWYLDVLKNKYAQFEGRAHREEFWMFFLVNFLVNVGLGIVGKIIGLPILQVLYGLAVLVPGLAVGARRLHDTNKSGWLQLLLLIPLIGLIILIVFWAQDSDPAQNQYGANPKGAAPAASPVAGI
jgi:uncharacterized membrane protein YhaH (DUF805 family)